MKNRNRMIVNCVTASLMYYCIIGAYLHWLSSRQVR